MARSVSVSSEVGARFWVNWSGGGRVVSGFSAAVISLDRAWWRGMLNLGFSCPGIISGPDEPTISQPKCPIPLTPVVCFHVSHAVGSDSPS